MSPQVLDTRRFLHTLRRHKKLVFSALLLGLLGGAAFTLLRPPLYTSKALVDLPGEQYIQTQVVVAISDSVLTGAMPHIDPAVPLATLRHEVSSSSLTTEIVQINGQGETAAQAEDITNAVASSYVSFLSSPAAPGGKIVGHLLDPASTAARSPLSTQTASLRRDRGSAVRADRKPHRALDRPRRPEAVGTRRDSRRHRCPRHRVGSRRSPVQRRGLAETPRGLRPRGRPRVDSAQGPASSGSDRRQGRPRRLAHRPVPVLRPRGRRHRPPAGRFCRLAGHFHSARRRSPPGHERHSHAVCRVHRDAGRLSGPGSAPDHGRG